MHFFLGREVLTMKDNNFELEEAISDILIKTSPFEQAGTVLTATEAYCSFLLNMLMTQIYTKWPFVQRILFLSILNFVVKALITFDVNFFR